MAGFGTVRCGGGEGMERLILVAYVALLVVQVFAYFAGAHA